MAAVGRVTVAATTLVAALGCYAPKETRGGDAAVQIYQRSQRASLAPALRGATGEAHGAPDENGADAPITVDTAIALAKRNSARLGELTARIHAADAAIERAGQRNNPELRATNVPVGRAIDGADNLRVTPRIRVPLERPGEIDAREAEARATSREARAEAHTEEISIESEIRCLFDDAALLDAEVAAFERAAETRRRLAAQAKDQLVAGTSIAVESSLSELSGVEADGRLAELRSRRELALGALRDRIGVGPRSKLELATPVTAWPPPALPSEQVLIEEALQASPRIAGAAARIDGASARLHLEQSRRWPWFHFVEIGYEIDGVPNKAPPLTVGAAIEMPIFNGNKGAIRQAEATKAAAKQSLESEAQRIILDVRGRLRAANEAASLVTEFRGAALPALERAAAETARALESGTITIMRALTVEERRNAVELELFKLMRRYRTAVSDLRQIVGGKLPDRAPSERR